MELQPAPVSQMLTMPEKPPETAWAVEFRWVVVKIMVPFWIPIIIRPLIYRVPKALNLKP